MNKVNIGLLGIAASLVLLYATASIIFFLPMFAFSMYFGWNYGKQHTNTHGA